MYDLWHIHSKFSVVSFHLHQSAKLTVISARPLGCVIGDMFKFELMDCKGERLCQLAFMLVTQCSR